MLVNILQLPIPKPPAWWTIQHQLIIIFEQDLALISRPQNSKTDRQKWYLKISLVTASFVKTNNIIFLYISIFMFPFMWNHKVTCVRNSGHQSPYNEHLSRYIKLRAAHAPGIPRTFSPPSRLSDPDMHHGTCVASICRFSLCYFLCYLRIGLYMV